jgi:hypothetical protein
MTTCLLLERLLLRVADALDDAGVELRVLKGPAIARLDYPDPARRSFGDVDVLVRSEQYETAVDVLCELGVPRFAEPRPGFTARFGKGVCILTRDGWEVDLHRAFVAGAFGMTARSDELFAGSSPFTVGTRTLTALDHPRRFLHACFHASLGDDPPRVLALRDVVELSASPGMDADAVLRWATDWRCRGVVARAVRLANAAFGLGGTQPLVEWAERYEPDGFERRMLRAYTGAHRSYAAQAVTGLAALDGWSARWDYARALLFPERDYVDARDGSYVRRLRRSLVLASQRGTR